MRVNAKYYKWVMKRRYLFNNLQTATDKLWRRWNLLLTIHTASFLTSTKIVIAHALYAGLVPEIAINAESIWYVLSFGREKGTNNTAILLSWCLATHHKFLHREIYIEIIINIFISLSRLNCFRRPAISVPRESIWTRHETREKAALILGWPIYL